MLKKYFTIIIILFFVYALDLKSEEIKFDQIPVDISFSGIISILEDKNGFIWLGTHEGLIKYDSTKFTKFKTIPGDINSLSDNYIFSIVESKKGKLLIGTSQGFNVYDPYLEKFKCYYPNLEDINSQSNLISTIIEGEKKTIWIGTSKGLFKFDTNKNEFSKNDKTINQFKNLPISTLFELNNILWVGTSNGLYKINLENKKFIHFKNDKTAKNGLKNRYITVIYKDKTGEILFGTTKGLSVFDKKTKTFISYNNILDKKEFFVTSIIEDRHGVLWIGTSLNGIIVLNKNKKILTNYKYENKIKKKFLLKSISSIYESKTGIIWMVGDAKYLVKVDENKISFNIFNIDENNKTDRINKFHYIYKYNKDTILLGNSKNGLFRFNSDNKFKKIVFKTPENNKYINNTIFSICRDKEKNLWVGTINGLIKINEKNGETDIFINEQNNPNSLSNNTVESVFVDKNENLWVGTFGGLDRYDKITNSFIHYKNNSSDNNSLSHNVVYIIFEDSTDDLWVGTYRGLNRLDRKNNTFIRYLNNRRDSNSLSNNKIITIMEDKNKILWIGTLGGGVNKFDKKKETFKSYMEKDGLIFNMISGLLEDESGNIWISTTKGLSIFDPKIESFSNFNIGGFNPNAAYISEKNEVFLGGYGLYKFSKESFNISKEESPIVLTKFTIFNKTIKMNKNKKAPLKKNITEAREIILDYKQNVFSFEFAVLDYSETGNNRYSYMMEGFTDKWLDLGKKNDITFTNLNPGEYVFRVKGKNSNGIWNKKGISIRVIIIPPFWKTLWFKSIFLLFIILLIIFLYKKRIKKIKQIIQKEFTLNQFYEKYNISEREKEVLELLVKGKTNREIEDILYISYHTVRVHVKNIYKKLNINNKTDLIIVLGSINSNTVKDKKS